MKLGRYVTVDDGGNYVTERSHKDKNNNNNNNNSSQRELGPPVVNHCRFVPGYELCSPSPSFFSMSSNIRVFLIHSETRQVRQSQIVQSAINGSDAVVTIYGYGTV